MQQVGQGDWKVLSISAEQPQVETPLKEQETELAMKNGIG